MSYTINFSDPLHEGFVVYPQGTNGPPSPSASTPLNIYGKGAKIWGEGVNENFLHILEKFAGATPPPTPLIGQLWFCIRYYWHNVNGNTFYQYSPVTELWTEINPNTDQPRPPTGNIGDYWFDLTTNTLYRWDRLSRIQNDAGDYLFAPSWMQRYYTPYVGGPTDIPLATPSKSMFVWNGEGWTVTASIVAQELAPTDPSPGSLWYDTTNRRLFLWDQDASVWIAIFLTTATSPMIGSFDANNNKIVGVLDPVANTDGANINYLGTAVGEASASATQMFADHISDRSRHLEPWQNDWMDAVTDALTGITAEEVNYLIGLNFNLQDRIDELAAQQQLSSVDKVNISGDTMTGFLTVPAYNDTITDPQLQAIQKLHVDINWTLSNLVDVETTSIQNGDVLAWSVVQDKWVPIRVANSVTIDITGTTTKLIAGGDQVQLLGHVVNSDNSQTDITNDPGTTWSVTQGNSYVTLTPGNPVTISSPANTPAETVVEVRLTYNDGIVTKTIRKAFNVVTVQSITVTGPVSVRHNNLVTYVATAGLSDSTTKIITAQCSWEFPIGTSVANPFTVATTVPIGVSVIKATYIGTTITGTLNVTVATGASALTITGPTNIYEGSFAYNFLATATLTAGGTQNVTTTSTWSIISGPGTIAAGTGVYTSPSSVTGSTPVVIQATNTTYNVTDTHNINVLDRPVPGFQEFTTPGTHYFNVPATYTHLRVTMVGGGGGGGSGRGNYNSSKGGGGGGGGGGYIQTLLTVPASSTTIVVVGVGGQGGWSDKGFYDGQPGGATSLYVNGSLSLTVAGGGGGKQGSGSATTGGAAGNANSGAGGRGGAGSSYPAQPGGSPNGGSAPWPEWGGGGGGGTPLGSGGDGRYSGSSHPQASGYGSGCGGGTGDEDRAGTDGGTSGYMKIEWLS